MDTTDFTLYMGLMATGVTCLGIVLNFIIKSRCTHLSCCGRQCIVRDVIPTDQIQEQVIQVPARINQGATRFDN